jgi:cytoskeleton protein RodZ
MTQETLISVEETPIAQDEPVLSSSAGTLLRSYREKFGVKLDVLASTLRVPVAKLQALEEDRLDLLPDAVFARALALAVCRHLKTDATPVLALLPGQDVSRLAVKDERGIDSPLHRPSFLPQSSFLAIQGFFTPMRSAALVVLGLAILLAVWPDVALWTGAPKQEATSEATLEPEAPVPAVVLPPVVESVAPTEVNTQNMVITQVQSSAISPPASSASGANNGR